MLKETTFRWSVKRGVHSELLHASSWSLELEGTLFSISPKQEAGHSPMWITVSMSLCFPVTWIIIWCKHYMLNVVKSSQICLPGIHLILWNIWQNLFLWNMACSVRVFFSRNWRFFFSVRCVIWLLYWWMLAYTIYNF